MNPTVSIRQNLGVSQKATRWRFVSVGEAARGGRRDITCDGSATMMHGAHHDHGN